jgi:LPXTG-motif cell wall-anchored protein
MVSRNPLRLATAIAVPALATTVLFTAAPAHAASGPEGYAFGVEGSLKVNHDLVVDDTVAEAEYPPGGEETVEDVDLAPLATAKLAKAESDVADDVLTSRAAVKGLEALHGLVSARFVKAKCEASDTLEGGSTVKGLTIAGEKVDLPEELPVGYEVALPDKLSKYGIEGEIVLNEQTDEEGGIQVTALRLSASRSKDRSKESKEEAPNSDASSDATESSTDLPADGAAEQPEADSPDEAEPDKATKAAEGKPAAEKPADETSANENPPGEHNKNKKQHKDKHGKDKHGKGNKKHVSFDAELVVGHVECYPAEEKPAPAPEPEPKQEPAEQPRPAPELPDTGASSNTLGMGVTGLFLVGAGSLALFATRRRGRHAG